MKLASLDVTFRKGSVALHDLSVFTGPSQFDVPGTVGNLGRDIWNGYRSVTLDFRRHRLDMHR